MNASHGCDCFSLEFGEVKRNWSELELHLEPQDTHAEGWKRLVELIERAASAGSEEFSPGREMGKELWAQVITLPSTISKLKKVKRFSLYGSSLTRIPPQIAEMTALEDFDLYTSYQLHWLPFEITRCQKLKCTRVSTRALYGNDKFRPPFPRLPVHAHQVVPESCSVCNIMLLENQVMQSWISIRVGSDVLPLLVHACSETCLHKLPQSAEGYVKGPHHGGLGLAQPLITQYEQVHHEKLDG